jgi:hypothetical protein
MHEFIHCYFMSLIDIATANNATTITAYPNLFESFNNIGSPTQSEHDVIVTNFRTILATSLQEYNTGIAVGNNTPQQIYLDLAMMGLTSTQTFSIFSEIEKNRISATIAAEVNNFVTTSNLYTPSNSVTAYPISQPCN